LGIFVTRRCGGGEKKKGDPKSPAIDIPMTMAAASTSNAQLFQPQRHESAPTVRARHSSKVYPIDTPVAHTQSMTESNSYPNLPTQRQLSFTPVSGSANFESSIEPTWIHGACNPAYEMEEGVNFNGHNQIGASRMSFSDSRM